MSNEIIFEQAEKFYAPVRELNKLAIANTEKLLDMQIASMKNYSALGLTQWKAALEVRDVATLQDFLARQGEVFQQVSDKMVSDFKAVSEMGEVYSNEAQKLAKVTVSKASAKAA
jgi:phasin family protein